MCFSWRFAQFPLWIALNRTRRNAGTVGENRQLLCCFGKHISQLTMPEIRRLNPETRSIIWLTSRQAARFGPISFHSSFAEASCRSHVSDPAENRRNYGTKRNSIREYRVRSEGFFKAIGAGVWVDFGSTAAGLYHFVLLQNLRHIMPQLLLNVRSCKSLGNSSCADGNGNDLVRTLQTGTL